MIFVYWMILKWIEFFERLNKPNHRQNHKTSSSNKVRRQNNDVGFVWFDHFGNENQEHNNNQQEGNSYDNDDSFDSPDW